jgi:hypothetical protein
LANPIVWAYNGQTLGYTVSWYHRPGDELVFVMAMNGAPVQIESASLYEKVLGILEPQSVVDPNAAPPPSSPQHDLAP